jgi:hypothetical protein
MISKWRKMQRAERLKYQGVIGFTLLAVYSLVFYPQTHTRFFEAKKMLSRKLNRIETRAGTDDLAKISGANPKVIEKKIEEVEARIQEIKSTSNELDAGFAPDDSSDMRQQLTLEISKLAERTGVEIVSVSRKGFSLKGEAPVAAIDPLLGRPLLVVTANASFDRLLNFLGGLKELSFYVSVMNLKVYSSDILENGVRKFKQVPAGGLYVSLEVSI